MKTHDFAKSMAQLARLLRSLPNVEVEDIGPFLRANEVPPQGELNVENVSTSLTMLLALGDVPKAQWMSLIQEHGFPIEVRAKDSSRDLMDRILRFLQNNREARNKLSHATSSTRSSTSPELQKALQILLRS